MSVGSCENDMSAARLVVPVCTHALISSHRYFRLVHTALLLSSFLARCSMSSPFSICLLVLNTWCGSSPARRGRVPTSCTITTVTV